MPTSRRLPFARSLAAIGLLVLAACSEAGTGSDPEGTGGTPGATGGSGGATNTGGVGTGGAGTGGAAGGGAAGATTGGTGNAPTVIPWGGATSHTCPDTLLNMGSGPGILCDLPEGSTCGDNDHRCECGAMTFEGAPWLCVPSTPSCPGSLPTDGDACTGTESCDFVSDGARLRCECEAGAWGCTDVSAFCRVAGARTGEPCAGHEGSSCDYLRPTAAGQPPPANVPCTCSEEGSWQCADGCPLAFTGNGGACDLEGVTYCSFRTDIRALYCHCTGDGAWYCLESMG